MRQLLIVVAIILLSGCVRNDCEWDDWDTTIDISPAISGGRITGGNFDSGDQIGLFAGVSPSTPGPDIYASNVPYTYDGTSWTAPGGSPLPWPGNVNLDIYAYWPYDPNLQTDNPRAYPFTVATDQTTREKYILNDFLWARADRNDKGEPVPLLFSHSMSRVSINIVSSFNAGADWPQRADVAILGLLRGTTINLDDGIADWERKSGSNADPGERVYKALASISNTPTPREEDDVFPLIMETPVTGYDLSVVAIVRPQEFLGGNPLVRITLDGEEYVFTPSANFNFTHGQTLRVNLTLVQQPPGLIVDLNDIDWDQSRVWNVYDGSTIVAQICREYLQGPSAPDVQAVVVYPVTGSAIDFASGYAARIYMRDKNGSGGYDVNPDNVHGGHVDFTSATLYTQGVLPPIRKVVIDPTSGITGTYDAARATLTVQPATVSDYNGNRYPVVKINQWYWTASNLRATRYRNGVGFTARPYGNDAANIDTYGLLYSGTIAYDPQGILPNPWHVPVEQESNAMHTYLQPQSGSKLKANRLWQSLDKSNDVTGFSMLPGGYKIGNGAYTQIGNSALWWTDTYNGFEGTYYFVSSSDENVNDDMISHEYEMSLRFVLTNPSALLGN